MNQSCAVPLFLAEALGADNALRNQNGRTEAAVEGEAGGAGKRITDLGGPPWNVVDTRLRFAIQNPGLTKATALDANFLPTGDTPITNGVVACPEDSLYLLLAP